MKNWTDKHIVHDELNDVWMAFDEAGLEHGSYVSLEAAREALERYAEQLEGRADRGDFS